MNLTSNKEKIEFLASKIGYILVTAALGFTNKDILKKDSSITLSDSQVAKLDNFLNAWSTISEFEGDDIARLWFISANPWMNDDSAIRVIREDRFEELHTAAKAFTENAWNL